METPDPGPMNDQARFLHRHARECRAFGQEAVARDGSRCAPTWFPVRRWRMFSIDQIRLRRRRRPDAAPPRLRVADVQREFQSASEYTATVL
jgi:hypothetical protein